MSERDRMVMAGVRAVLSAILLISLLMLAYLAGPYLETRFAPVVSKLTIVRLEAVSPTQTKVWAAFTKLRQCDYLGISWYHREFDHSFVRVPVQLLREPGDVSSPNRPVGTQQAGPWIIDIPIEHLRSESFVELQHSCHPGWTTVTEFYP
jgi:hypothetical protein